MSEYIIDGTLLTNIANGIRKVDGTTAKLTPAQMQEKLTIIKTSVDGALNQVKNKGVTVPSGSDVHDLWNLIGSIELGGGLPEGVSAIATGVYTPSSNITTQASIQHGLGVKPNFFFMQGIGEDITTYTINTYASSNYNYLGQSIRNKTYYFGGSRVTGGLFTSSKVTIIAPTTGGHGSEFVSGIEYHWIAGVYA